MYKSILTHGVFFFFGMSNKVSHLSYGTNSPKKLRIHEVGGTTFCKMSGGLDMSWLDEIQKNNPLKRCQIISACAQNTVKERAVVCR